MLSAEAIKELERLALAGAGQTVTIGDVTYATAPIHDVRKPEPEPKALELSSLTGLVDYIRRNRDQVDLSAAMIHIAGPRYVRLVSDLYGEFEQRDVYVTAATPDRLKAANFAWGAYASLEAMNISVQSLFVDDADRAKVLRLLGTVTDEAVTVQADDGITQRATARHGIAGMEEVKVPNPVKLSPYRTFAEIEQPSSPFVLRMQRGGGRDGVTAALFEADGGAWTLDAVERIRTFLTIEIGNSELSIIG